MGLDNIFLILGVIDPEQIQVLKDVFLCIYILKEQQEKELKKYPRTGFFKRWSFETKMIKQNNPSKII